MRHFFLVDAAAGSRSTSLKLRPSSHALSPTFTAATPMTMTPFLVGLANDGQPAELLASQIFGFRSTFHVPRIFLALCLLVDQAEVFTDDSETERDTFKASHGIAFSTNRAERASQRQRHTLTTEFPTASLATRMNPLGFPFRVAAGKDAPSRYAPTYRAPRDARSIRHCAPLYVPRIRQLPHEGCVSLLAGLRCELVHAAL